MKNIVDGLIQVESGGDVNAVGDTHLAQHAYGILQIRQTVCDDVNEKYGTRFRAQDMLGHYALPIAVFWLYMSIYATSDHIGRPPTDQDRARIWNGGPSAWNPDSSNPEVQRLYAATTVYWNQVRNAMSS